MSNAHTTATVIADAIEAGCEHRWGVWLSDTGKWWAARTHALTAEALTAGCMPFLQSDNPDELATQIGEQDQLWLPVLGREVA